jgi:tight adherence protein C
MTLNPINQVILIIVGCALAAMGLVRLYRWHASRNAAPRRRRVQLQPAQRPTVANAPQVRTSAPQVRPSTTPVVTPAVASAPITAPAMVAPLPAAQVPVHTLVATAKPPVAARSAPVLVNSAVADLPAIEADETPLADGSDYAFGPVTSLLASLLPESEERKQANKKALRNAGYYEPHAWHNLAAARYLGVIAPIILCLGLLLVAPPHLEPWLIGGIVVLPMLGWALPTLHVRRQAAERLAEIEQSMPDLLDMMNMCVSQGMTVPASLQRVGSDIESVSPALSKELKIVTEQARVGSLEQALAAFGKRVDRPEVYSFTSLLLQTERMGTSMSQALAEYSDSMRETLRQQADQKANTAAFKLLFPTVLCLMPAVFMILLGPAIIEMSDFFREGGSAVLDNSMNSASGVLERGE